MVFNSLKVSVAGLLYLISVQFLCAAHKIQSPWGKTRQFCGSTRKCQRAICVSTGKAGQMPREPFVFLKEDLQGTNPKFDIRDGNETSGESNWE